MSQLPAIFSHVAERQADSLNCVALYGVTCSLYLPQEWKKKNLQQTLGSRQLQVTAMVSLPVLHSQAETKI